MNTLFGPISLPLLPMGIDSAAPALSLIIPVYNEAGNVLAVAEGAVNALRELGWPFEILFVNDRSTDATSAEISRAHERWPECRELALAEHGGQAVALLTGLHAARAPLIATMDGDGQNDPRDLPALLALVESGKCDFACGWRVDRHDSLVRKVMSRIANLVRGAILRDGVHDSGCQLRVFRREIVRALEPMELLQSFIPALVVAAGFRVAEKPVKHHARIGGRSKYGLHNLWWRPALAMLALRWRLWRRRTG